jgi:hypothetical protein
MNRFRIASGLAAMAAAACVALTACGGSSATSAGSANAGSTSAGSANAAATASPTGSTSLAAFQSCLKAHGVKVQPGGFGGTARPFPSGSARPFPSGTPRPRPTGSFTRRPSAFASGGADSAAFKDCEKYAPAGFGSGGFGGGFQGVSASAIAAFKSCMSQNGAKVTGTTAQQIFASLRNATGKTATAEKTCRALLQPSGGATPSPSPGS